MIELISIDEFTKENNIPRIDFIKSDIERLQRQMNVLWKIVDEGWQILYFTAKEEVKEALKKDIMEEKVNLIETNWITL